MESHYTKDGAPDEGMTLTLAEASELGPEMTDTEWREAEAGDHPKFTQKDIEVMRVARAEHEQAIAEGTKPEPVAKPPRIRPQLPKDGEGLRSALKILRYEFRFSIRGMRPELRKSSRGKWRELDDLTEAVLRKQIADNFAGLSDRKIPLKFGDDAWRQAMLWLCAKSQCDPFIEWLESLPEWDGTERLCDLLHHCLNAEFEPDDKAHDQMIQLAGAYVLIGAVQRAYDPGAKHDEMVVLISPQGRGKSTFIEYLFPKANRKDWLSDSLNFAASIKEQIESIGPAVIVAANELEGLNYTDGRKLKSFLSGQRDRCRMAYARHSKTLERRWVVVGTANDDGCGVLPNDPTGSRRFIAVEVQGQPTDQDKERMCAWLDKWREQLWAEALYRYQEREEIPYLKDDEASVRDLINEDYRRSDLSIEEAVRQVLDDWAGAACNGISVLNVVDQIRKDELLAKHEKISPQRVSRAMKNAKWWKEKKKVGGRAVWLWFPPR